MNIENKQIICFVLIIAIGLFLLYNRNEGYDSATFRSNDLDNYYLWRAYGHNVYDYDRLNKYPYNQQPKSHPQRFDYYLPSFYQYGYGHL